MTREEEAKIIEQMWLNGLALEYVREPTEEMCLAAVRGDVHALEYVLVQTEEVCLVAMREDGHVLGYVRDEELRAKIKGMIDGER